LNTVVIKSANREKIQQAVYAYAQRLRDEYPEIIRIIWFGSWPTGIPTPGSDVDLCLIVSTANPLVRERASVYLPVGFPVGIDLLVYTQTEFDSLAQRSAGWQREILKGIDL
jgi:uncharacterized protein